MTLRNSANNERRVISGDVPINLILSQFADDTSERHEMPLAIHLAVILLQRTADFARDLLR